MQFVHPYFLFGLFAVAIPVIIHLFNFRRYRKIYFTNVRFIKELKKESRRKSKLKHLLVLLARIFAVICLVLAFAQPYFPDANSLIQRSERKQVSIYLDNSFSMEARMDEATLFELAKMKAEEIANAYEPSDLFNIVTNDFEGKHYRFVNRDEFVRYLDETGLSPAFRTLSDVFKRQYDLFESTDPQNRILYLVSDFQKSIANFSEIPVDSTIMVNFIPVQSPQVQNLYIDSCWFDSPVQQLGQKLDFIVQVKNVSDVSYEKIPLRLTLNGSQRGVAGIDIEPGGVSEISLPFVNRTPGIHYGEISLKDYPVTYDDNLFFSFVSTASIPVLHIFENQPNASLKSVFSNDSLFSYTSSAVTQLDYSAFNKNRLIVIENITQFSSGFIREIKSYLEDGGSVTVFPGEEAELNSYKQLLGLVSAANLEPLDTLLGKVDYLNEAHPLFEDVFEKLPGNIDLPTASAIYPYITTSGSRTEVLLRMQNDLPFIVVEPVGKGKFYFATVPLGEEYTNFTRHAIFVPVLYRMAILSAEQQDLYYNLPGLDEIILSENRAENDQVYKIRSLQQDFEMIPEIRSVGGKTSLLPHGIIKNAGNYELILEERVVRPLSYNYNRNESDLSVYEETGLVEQIEETGMINGGVITSAGNEFVSDIENVAAGKQLWKLFVYLSLLFIAIEILILRFMK